MNTKLSKSVVTLKLKQLNKRRARCTKCNKVKTYLNPTAKCFKCGKPFCFDHIWYELIKEGKEKVSKLRHICDACKEEINTGDALKDVRNG